MSEDEEKDVEEKFFAAENYQVQVLLTFVPPLRGRGPHGRGAALLRERPSGQRPGGDEPVGKPALYVRLRRVRHSPAGQAGAIPPRLHGEGV